MKRAVITGASGVVGTALMKELARRQVNMLVLLREESPGNARVHRLAEALEAQYGVKMERIECSLPHLRDFHRYTDITRHTDYDVFYHLGWGGTKGRERYDPYIHNRNVEYALDAVDLAGRLGCSLFIGAGSQAEYGRSLGRLTANTVPRPDNAYGIAKLCAGHMTREYAHEAGLRHIWTRILSVYGPNDGEKTLVTYLVKALLRGERPRCTAGEQLWDFLASEDAAKALCALGERGKDGETYLIASGRERLLKDYILEIRDLIAPGAEIGFGEVPYGPRQVMHLSADISDITRDTGWTPQLSFAEGIMQLAREIRREEEQA